MNKLFCLLSLIGILLITACADRQLKSSQKDQKELETLVSMMTGEFSSEEQAQKDTLFYNINLVMHPIWTTDKEAKWLYVEQAVTKFIDKPYRQRVYRLKNLSNGIIESRVYELSSPEKYIHAWDNESIFDRITPDSLIVRQGCAVFLKKTGDACYSGSTKDDECKSNFRKASYATSRVTVCEAEVQSWDQGWNDQDEQVWGAVKGGYIFKKKKTM